MEERFSFVDKETGDVVETALIGELDGRDSISRAFAGFTGTSLLVSEPMAVEYDFMHAEKLHSKGVGVPTNLFTKTEALTIEMASPCAKKPRNIAPTHFYAGESRFSVVKTKIQSVLSQREELVFSLHAHKQSWKCKYLEGSQSREVHVSVFFDKVKGDHVVEVKRVHGDGLFPQYADLMSLLQTAFGIAVKEKKVVRRGPLTPPSLTPIPSPLPSTASSISIASSSSSTSSSAKVDEADDERPAATLRFLHELITSSAFESRVEGVKMACDFAQSMPMDFLSHKCVSQQLLEHMTNVLHDEFPEVVEFAVCTIYTLLSRSHTALNAEDADVYASEARRCCAGSLLTQVLRLTKNSEKPRESDESDYYLYAQMRRFCAQILSFALSPLLRKHEGSVEVQSKCLQSLGVGGLAKWEEYVQSLDDEVVRDRLSAIFTK